jgi:hypothetical protein
MTATRGSALYTDLLPVPVRPTSRENEWFPTGKPSLRKRASRALSSLIAFCAGVAGACAWWSYGDVTRQMIGNSYPQLGWFAPRHPAAVHKAPDRIAPTASDAPDQRQLDAMLGDDLHAIRLSLDRIVAAQELIARSIDEIATRIVASQEQMTPASEPTSLPGPPWVVELPEPMRGSAEAACDVTAVGDALDYPGAPLQDARYPCCRRGCSAPSVPGCTPRDRRSMRSH